MNTPWNSINESVVTSGLGRQFKLGDARSSPCATCTTSPCCTHLPLNTFAVTNLVELDHALYLLNFEHIELGLSAAGEWSAYYTYPCRFLDRNSYKCGVHEKSDQPQICVHYNPYNCWYKRVFTVADSDEFVRIDRDRMAMILAEITFDEDRQITSVPAWGTIVDMMKRYKDKDQELLPEPSITDPVIEAWGEGIIHGKAAHDGVKSVAFDSLNNPCAGCSAHCCQTLVFPQYAPTHVSNLDYFRFCLGFPGVELGISDGVWSLVVKTNCIHLKDNLCSIMDSPDRPLICKYYDEWKCLYKNQFGTPRPDDFMRVRLEQMPWLTENLTFDEQGNIAEMPALEQMRQHIELRWQQSSCLQQEALA